MSKPDTKPPRKVVILVDDELAYTVQQIATKYGMERNSVATFLKREKIPVAAPLDDHKNVYLARLVDAAFAARPGQDWRKGKGYRPGTA